MAWDPRYQKIGVAPLGVPQPTQAGAPNGTQLQATPQPTGMQPFKPMVIPGMPMIDATQQGMAPLPKPQQPPPSGLSVGGAVPQPMPPMILPPAPPGGQPLQGFGPGNDLRGTQINPYTGDRLQGVQNQTDVLAKALGQGPNLMDAATRAFDVLGQQTAEARQRGIRDIGQSAARLGRLGSGMVTTDLGNLEDVLQQHQNQARQQLASQTAFAQGNEARANLGAAQGFEQQLYGQGAANRNEVRTERDYQSQQAQQAFEQEILRRQLEAQYQQMLTQLGLQGAGIYGDQAAAGQQAASTLLGGAFQPPRTPGY